MRDTPANRSDANHAVPFGFNITARCAAMIAVRSATVAPKRIQISRIAGSNSRASLRVRTVDKVGSGHEDRRPEETSRHLLRDAH